MAFKKNFRIHHACERVKNTAQIIKMTTTHILNLQLQINVIVEVFKINLKVYH